MIGGKPQTIGLRFLVMEPLKCFILKFLYINYSYSNKPLLRLAGGEAISLLISKNTMKKFFRRTLSNIMEVEELRRQDYCVTLGLLCVSFSVPGSSFRVIDSTQLGFGIEVLIVVYFLGIIECFNGEHLFQCSVFCVGIMSHYSSMLLFVQLMGIAILILQEITKGRGEEVVRKTII